MKKLNTLLITGVLVFAAIGCAHAPHQKGSVVMVEKKGLAHICLGSEEVKVGDAVSLFNHECTEIPGGRASRSSKSCTKTLAGRGEIIDVIDQHYSTVRYPDNLSIRIGSSVEKEGK